MRSMLILVVLVFTCVLAKDVFDDIYLDQPDNEVIRQYLYLKPKYSDEERPARERLVSAKLNLIRSHNANFHAGRETYHIGLNKFTDWWDEDFNATLGFKSATNAAPHNGFNYILNGVQIVSTLNKHKEVIDDELTIDLSKHVCAGNVSDQGKCGSCYAFSAVQSLDQNYCMQCGETLSMNSSVQNIVDCCAETYGCNGGGMSRVTDFIKTVGGIDTAFTYPYTAAQGTCKFDSSAAQHKQVTGYVEIRSQDENDLMKQLAQDNTICIAVKVGLLFQMYKGGIFKGPLACHARPDEVNHAVLLVGYGKENGVMYWLIKNSWGSDWGENGYIRIARGNCCAGMCYVAGYPTFMCSAAK